MNKQMLIILGAIGSKVGLNADQVKDLTVSGELNHRYQLCKDCRMACDRCQISYRQVKNKAPM